VLIGANDPPLAGDSGAATVTDDRRWGGFLDGSVPADGDSVRVVERVIAATSPDVVDTHAPRDTHQDHRQVVLETHRGDCGKWR
jgi:LmbE family N-acetylglucosaminyl deacetylase